MKRFISLLTIAVTLVFCSSSLIGQTTGKIAGIVTDEKTGEPLPSVNVSIEGTSLGAATGMEGDYFILNVPPGIYVLKVQMIGYEPVRVEDVRVSVNLTSNIDIQLKEGVISGEEVVVTARKISFKKSETSSVSNVSSDEINMLPVKSLGDLISLQAGVVNNHFRGGRRTEVSFLVDGMPVDDAFAMNNLGVNNGSDVRRGSATEVETEAIQEVEVITGTFNAEYGRAMSGVVNAVTKEGGTKFHGSFNGFLSNYYTGNKDVFIGLKNSEADRNQDYRGQLSGPLFGKRITFFTNFRYQNNKSYLNGVRRFRVDDLSDYSRPIGFDENGQPIYFEMANGDSAFIPMDRDKNISLLGKLTYNFTNTFKVAFLYSLNDDEYNDYDHQWKYNPDGRATSYRNTDFYSLSITHMLASNAFYNLKLFHKNHYNGYFIFENPTDSSYVNDVFNTGTSVTGFLTGGQQKDHDERTLKDYNVKFDLIWQIHKSHSFKTGILFTQYDLAQSQKDIQNRFARTEFEDFLYEPEVRGDSTIYSDIYNKKPKEFAAYFQDKMEFKELTINAGVRFDYFDPSDEVPSNWRNPGNNLRFPDEPERMSTYASAKVRMQLSPRLGLSYQLADAAKLHFSYGHFFQTPQFSALYRNNSYLVGSTDYDTNLIMGNPEVKPEKTVSYEIGFWQEIMQGMDVELSLFYRDIYDLLTLDIFSTYNNVRFGVFGNKDYANVRGLELKYNFSHGPIYAGLNYSASFTRGNADDPQTTFDRAGNNQDPIPTLIPLAWDQRHTVNTTVGYNQDNYGITITGRFGTGQAYTFTPIADNPVSRVNLLPNNQYKPTFFNVDLRTYYDFTSFGKTKFRISMDIYNLFDRLNENTVNGDTGRANQRVTRENDILSHRSTWNTYEDRVLNPSQFSAPREVKIGLGFVF